MRLVQAHHGVLAHHVSERTQGRTAVCHCVLGSCCGADVIVNRTRATKATPDKKKPRKRTRGAEGDDDEDEDDDDDDFVE